MPMLPGTHLLDNYHDALIGGTVGAGSKASVGRMMWVSLVMALMITIGKIAISLLSAFAIVYFRFPFKMFFFWAIFVTLMLPVGVRIAPTYKVVADLGMLNTYAGLTVPLIASATATFLFRQFFLTVPDELVEAARMDGAGPMRFFKDVLLPLSKTSMAALFVIQFIYGWNQYLWPLLVTTDEKMYPIVMGIKRLIFGEVYIEWNVVMATAILAMLPPALFLNVHPDYVNAHMMVPTGPETVRIVLSGYTDLSAVTDAINRGAIYKFLTKPWNDEELRAQIREAFRVSRPARHHETDSTRRLA
jgi:sn-glycerol 3-phosphate transport system permease protein